MTPARPEPGLLALRRPTSSAPGRLLTHILIAALLFALAPPHAIAATSIRLGPRTAEDLVHPSPTSSPRDVLVCGVVIAVVTPPGLTKSAFGELLSHTGTDPQPYAFTGEPLDPNSGFQYHRARWMDPRTGRFAGMDPFDGVTSDPPSLHRYLYAHAGPVDAFDPTGQMTLAQGLSVASMVARIATISIVSYQVVNIVRLTATEEITVEDAMYQLAEIGRDQAIAYVGGHLLNGVVKFGRVPASKIPQLLSLVHRNRLKGKFAESLWAAGNGVTKNRGRLGGRIPDFVRGKVWDELKYYEGKSVMYLTKQLRDMTAYAGRHGIQFNLHAIPGANVSADLAAAVARTGGSVVYDLPRLQAQAFTMAAAAADDFVDAEDFWP